MKEISDLLTEKVCKDCKIQKPASEFYFNSYRKDKLDTYCKPCNLMRIQKRRSILIDRKDIKIPLVKKCYRCGLEKLGTDFTKCKYNLEGLSSYCKTCNAARLRTRGSLEKANEAKDLLLKLEWKPIPKTFGDYLASQCGTICSKERQVIRSNGLAHTTRQRILKVNPDTNGYLQFTPLINKERKRMAVHTAVYEAWKDIILEGYEIDHIDGDILNNHINNLQLVTRQEHSKLTNERIKQKYIKEGYEKALAEIRKGERGSSIC